MRQWSTPQKSKTIDHPPTCRAAQAAKAPTTHPHPSPGLNHPPQAKPCARLPARRSQSERDPLHDSPERRASRAIARRQHVLVIVGVPARVWARVRAACAAERNGGESQHGGRNEARAAHDKAADAADRERVGRE